MMHLITHVSLSEVTLGIDDLDTTEFMLVVYTEKEDIDKYMDGDKEYVMYEVPFVLGE